MNEISKPLDLHIPNYILSVTKKRGANQERPFSYFRHEINTKVARASRKLIPLQVILIVTENKFNDNYWRMSRQFLWKADLILAFVGMLILEHVGDFRER